MDSFLPRKQWSLTENEIITSFAKFAVKYSLLFFTVMNLQNFRI